MSIKNSIFGLLVSGLIVLTVSVSTKADPVGESDFGATLEKLLRDNSYALFGIVKPLIEPANTADFVPREVAKANQRVKLAKGLSAEFVTRKLAHLGDMISFWPNDIHYTHLIVCIEQGRSGKTPAGNSGLNASVQRVEVKTGKVSTILHGMSRCDGIATTPWGTVLATEETTDGRAYEIVRPLETTGHWVANRATGDIRSAIDGATPSKTIVQRQALPTMAWEGLAVLQSGVVIAGDELRPGSTELDSDGGALFKFLPDSPRVSKDPITDLSQSPLVSGRTYAMQVSCVDENNVDFPLYGQGCELGTGAWVKVDALIARKDAFQKGATGYYRPEDLHLDPKYTGTGTRFCWTNTGNEDAKNYGEVICAVDFDPLPQIAQDLIDSRTGHAYLSDGVKKTYVISNRFIEGDSRFNSLDNLAFNPVSGHLYVVEDHPFGEVFACLPDGKDRDTKSDGCISILSVIDPSAEPTGFIFDGTGKVAFMVVQHGQTPKELNDYSSNPVDGKTDDLIRLTGFARGKK